MLQAALLLVFPALMAYAAASDLLTMTIPNKLSLALVATFILFAVVSGLPWQLMLMHIGAGTAVLAVSFGMFAFGWIGGGDAKLAAATALWLGFGALLDYLFLASLLGGALTLALLLMRSHPLPSFAMKWNWLSRLHEPQAGVPYGIALASAALLVYPHCPIWIAALAR